MTDRRLADAEAAIKAAEQKVRTAATTTTEERYQLRGLALDYDRACDVAGVEPIPEWERLIVALEDADQRQTT